MERFKDKVAIITGGAQGIGEAIARKLAAEGATVAILDIQHDRARLVADNISSEGGNAIAVSMDITDSPNVRNAVKEVEKRFGRVDILVNNAGWDKAAPFIELAEELWDKVIAINLRGPITVTRAVLDGMISRNYGRIVSIASDAGRVGSSGESVYSACKGGIIAFTKTLARELVRYNILVNCVCPGPTETPLIGGMREESPKLVEALQRAVPMRRLGNPEEIAAAVAFLASDEASYITGQTLSVSGGLTMA
jgi:2-hydroxycyclohexanecarboxyl-CoA dehydrogenase